MTDDEGALESDIKLIGTALSLGDHPGGVTQAFYRIAAAVRSPSAPGAAEPVARDTNMFSRLADEPLAVIPEGYSAPLDIRTAAEVEFDRKAAKSALPPVRGDREAIARALAIAFHGDEVEWRGFLTKADTFLAALPVQPGAGEREWPQPFTTAPRDGTPILARCNDHSEMYALRWDGEHWACRDAQTTFGDGLFLPNGDWCLDPFSRQPPQSSSERTAPESCRNCFDESDCSNVDVCRAVVTTDPSTKGDGNGS